MKTQARQILLAALVLIALPLHAQLVADSATNTLSNITNSITGTATVGTNGSFTLLVLSDNALVTNSLNGVIGRNLTAKSNEVRLLSATARWRMGGSLFVGSNGASSTLVVSNGALLENQEGLLGRVQSSSNNFALVTGSGSVWNNRDNLYVGSSSPANRIVVSNGGWVTCASGVLGRESTSSSNLVWVTGSGSVWSNSVDLAVGSAASGNRLVIEAGGLVSYAQGVIGSGSGNNNNEVLVTGPGSLWKGRSFTTYIGFNGSFNRLVVSNGAAATSPGGIVGGSTFCVSNQVLVSGAGSTWSNLGMTIGSGSSSHRADVSDGGRILTGKATVGFLGFNNMVFVKDPSSAWNGQGDLIIGDIGSGNLLVASNGATVLSSNATLGAISAPGFGPGDNNLALLTGPGTLWSNRFEFYVGAQGAGNQLIVSNGASMVSSNLYLGMDLSSSNNSLVVTGPGTFWTTVNDLVVGDSGAGNQLKVSNGATLYAADSLIGNSSSAVSNSVTVTDPGTKLIVPSVMNIGQLSSYNRLLITNGAVVDRGLCILSSASLGGSNQVVVTGAGSVWTNMSSLWLGTLGGGHQLVITNGGRVHTDDARITFNPTLGFHPNELLVTGSGSWLNCRDYLVVGSGGNGSILIIASNGTVQAGTFVNVGSSGTTNNFLIVNDGALRVTNALGAGLLNIQVGSNILNAGLIDVDQLLLTNAFGKFQFNAGTLRTANTTISNGQTFLVGTGSTSATLELKGGTHTFANQILVAADASVIGNGTVVGPLILSGGSSLSPGTSLGKIVLSNSPVMAGAVLMEISKNGSLLTNDQIQVANSLTYGGSLVVSNLGPGALAVGDRFPLFIASSYAGGFTQIVLPPMSPGLGWTNKLLVDGSIEVIAGPKFTDISVSGTNVIFSGTNGTAGANYAVLTATNVATPLGNWLSLITNQFGPGGSFSFTNAITPGELQRYFRLRTP